MGKDFMRLLKVYIDDMQACWKSGECDKIHTLAVAITDMTKNSDMLDLVAGHPQYPRTTTQVLHSAAAEVIIEDEKEDEH